eukprot:g11893.t1
MIERYFDCGLCVGDLPLVGVPPPFEFFLLEAAFSSGLSPRLVGQNPSHFGSRRSKGKVAQKMRRPRVSCAFLSSHTAFHSNVRMNLPESVSAVTPANVSPSILPVMVYSRAPGTVAAAVVNTNCP